MRAQLHPRVKLGNLQTDLLPGSPVAAPTRSGYGVTQGVGKGDRIGTDA
jgi:hypothetical protein